MSVSQRLKHELKAVALATLYFAVWLGTLLWLKKLILAEYNVEVAVLSKAIVGALILAKVVLILEHVPLGAWTRSRPAWVDVALRTGLYGVGVVVVLLLEKGFEGRHDHGGFGRSLAAVFDHADIHHVWINTMCVTGALLVYNALAIVRGHLGEGGLLRMFMTPPLHPLQHRRKS